MRLPGPVPITVDNRFQGNRVSTAIGPGPGGRTPARVLLARYDISERLHFVLMRVFKMKNKPLYKGYPYVLLCMYNRSFPVDYVEPIEHYLIGEYDSIA